jgi:hypothetical protein
LLSLDEKESVLAEETATSDVPALNEDAAGCPVDVGSEIAEDWSMPGVASVGDTLAEASRVEE